MKKAIKYRRQHEDANRATVGGVEMMKRVGGIEECGTRKPKRTTEGTHLGSRSNSVGEGRRWWRERREKMGVISESKRALYAFSSDEFKLLPGMGHWHGTLETAKHTEAHQSRNFVAQGQQ